MLSTEYERTEFAVRPNLTNHVCSAKKMDLDSIKEFLKLAPGLILLPASLYLAWKKLFNQASVSLTISHSRISGTQITNITINNRKDKPLIVCAVHIVIDRDHCITVHSSSPPVIVKGLEATNIVPAEVSGYWLRDQKIDDPFSRNRLIETYITTPDSTFRCTPAKNQSILAPKEISHFQQIYVERVSFNGAVYNENSIYALYYKVDGKERVAIIDRSGFIGKDWGYLPNFLPPELMKSKEAVESAIRSQDVVSFFDWLHIQELNPYS